MKRQGVPNGRGGKAEGTTAVLGGDPWNDKQMFLGGAKI